MSVPPLGVVVNRRSRRNLRDDRVVDRFVRIVGRMGIVEESADEADLERIAERFAREGVGVLVLSGGDGTNGFTLGAFHRVYGDRPLPDVSLLRGGTMNTVANAIGVPRSRPERLLAALTIAVARGEPLESTRRSTLLVDALGARPAWLFGTGIGRTFLEEYYAAGPQPTPVTAAKTLARFAGSATVGGELARSLGRREPAEVVIDGERMPEPAFLAIMAGTVDQLGLGFRAFPRTGPDVDAFEVLAIHSGPRKLTTRLGRIRVGAAIGEDVAHSRLARSLRIATPSGRVPFFVDGDLFEAESPLTVTTGAPVRFVWSKPG